MLSTEYFYDDTENTLGVAFLDMKEFFTRETFVGVLLGHISKMATILQGSVWTVIYIWNDQRTKTSSTTGLHWSLFIILSPPGAALWSPWVWAELCVFSELSPTMPRNSIPEPSLGMQRWREAVISLHPQWPEPQKLTPPKKGEERQGLRRPSVLVHRIFVLLLLFTNPPPSPIG